ncbi:MAG: helix-turn-helix domain-containing protein [Pseudoclavibacter sp.]
MSMQSTLQAPPQRRYARVTRPTTSAQIVDLDAHRGTVAAPPRPRTVRPALEPASNDYREFCGALAHAAVTIDIETPSPQAFHGRVGSWSLGDMHLLRVDAGTHAVHRTAAQIALDPTRLVEFLVVERGRAVVVQDGGSITLGQGDMTLYDSDRPYSIVADGDVRIAVLIVPRDVLAVAAEHLETSFVTRWRDVDGAGAVVGPSLVTLASQAGDLHAGTVQRLARSATGLISALIEDAIGDERADARGELLRRILEHVDANLSDHALSPASIAAAHYISVRHLHALFSEHELTVASCIRNRRLERSYEQLLLPALAGGTMVEIAEANGFSCASHFSRVFRARFGVPPSAVRRHAS